MPEYTDILGNAQEAVGVFMAEDRTYLDMSGKLQEAEGVFITDTLLYDDLSGNAREAQGVFIVGGGLPSDQAIVENGEIVTAVGGQTIDIQVTDNVATFGVRPFPFWEPFTVTVGSDDFNYGYNTNSDGGIPVMGSITNEPIDGFILTSVLLGGDTLRFNIQGGAGLINITQSSLIGVGGQTYSPILVEEVFEEGEWRHFFMVEGVAPWTAGQSIPIVIIPQNG